MSTTTTKTGLLHLHHHSNMSKRVTSFYAYAVGGSSGIVRTWDACSALVSGKSGAAFKKFPTAEEARSWLDTRLGKRRRSDSSETSHDHPHAKLQKRSDDRDKMVIYTDGSALGNGTRRARAGFGVWFGKHDPRNVSERLPGPRQTNQRAEVAAGIRALELLRDTPPAKPVLIRSDNIYLIKSATQWVKGWRRTGFDKLKNRDLLKKLCDTLAEVQRTTAVSFEYVKGHSNDAGNDAADALARAGAMKSC